MITLPARLHPVCKARQSWSTNWGMPVPWWQCAWSPGSHFNSKSSFCVKDSYDLIVSQLQNLTFSSSWELQSFIGDALLLCGGIFRYFFLVILILYVTADVPAYPIVLSSAVSVWDVTSPEVWITFSFITSLAQMAPLPTGEAALREDVSIQGWKISFSLYNL